MSAIYVEITKTRGSTPRDAGTVMKVTGDSTIGTIGGGALEHRAIATARHMLTTGQTGAHQTIPLGPGLGQCCGGTVTLHFTTDRLQDTLPPLLPLRPPAQTTALPLWLWGAGHVGRAVVAAAPPGAFDITWVDDSPARFPDPVPPHITALPASDMPLLAACAPCDAHHLIFTYSHDIDLALCAALLRRGFAFCGLIGSATKWARFGKRLRAAGLDPAPITCPIGDTSLGKHPDAIAHGTLLALTGRERVDA